jgi:hypothetical protein
MGMNPRLLRPTASGFDPRRIAGLVAWWDWSDASTVTLNGTSVSATADKSGNGHTLSQTTAGNQPPYILAGLNGRNVRGAGNLLNSTTFSVSQPNTFFCVAKIDAGVTVTNRRFFDNLLVGARQTSIFAPTIPAPQFWSGSSFIGNTSAAVSSGGPAFVNTVQFNGASSFGRANGVQYGSGNSGSNNLGAISIGAEGSGLAGVVPGIFGEVLMYGSLTLSQVQAIEKYLMTKWGIA